jgi:hypothetical protein
MPIGEDGDTGDQNGSPDFRVIVGMDPDANWLLGPARADFLPGPMPIPFLLVLESAEAVEAFKAVLPVPRADEGAKEQFRATVIGFGDSPVADIRPKRPVAVAGSLSFFEEVARAGRDDEALYAFQQAPKRIMLSSPSRGSGASFVPREGGGSGETFGQESVSLALPEEPRDLSGNVFVAVFDDGIAFAHDRFRDGPETTRVQSFWNMNMMPAGILSKTDIDLLLAAHPRDEDAIYQATGLVDHRDRRHKTAAWRLAHGTHVLDLAAGFDWRTHPAEAAKRPIIGVEFPASVIAETLSPRLPTHLALAMGFTLLSVPPGADLVVNISLGYVAGPHDGATWIEDVLDTIIADKSTVSTRVVMSAGNAHLDRLHADLDLTGEAASAEIGWVVQPDDFTESVVEIWLPPHAGPPANGRLRVTVTAPTGQWATVSEPDAGDPLPEASFTGADGKVFGWISVDQDVFSGRRYVKVRIMPTVRFEPDILLRARAPAGRWVLQVERLPFECMDRPFHVHAWVQRDDSIYGYPLRGRQSYFDHPDYVRYDLRGFRVTEDPAQGPCPVKRASLVNAVATGRQVLTAGGYRERDLGVAEYSAGGPNTPAEAAGFRKPDALLPSDTSRAHRGVLAAGSRSGAMLASSGTSAAAPQLARIVADQLEAKADSTRAGIKALAQARPAAPPLPVPRGGWGRLPRSDAPRVRRVDV